ncbi:hypothetical protein FCULG_00002515 [Fusarium culmorum]|uniref:Uncharacterized protein n=1 Tax=Fusarium culmorum TaxID=5516 RepID=A0A2T4GLU8_FUSCU|nr:hypothetical protein FCULG_00002515 [Fusarium culmorum]
MGNEQSAETPRGHRKLSKPPHCSQTTAAGLPYAATAVTPHCEHYSNSYLVGSLPPTPNKASSTRRVAPGLGIAVPTSDGVSPVTSPTCRESRRDSMRRRSSVQSEQSPRLPSFVNSSRASSMAQDSGYRTLARADSMPVAVPRDSTGYNTRAAEPKLLLGAKEKLPSEPITSKFKIHSDEAGQDVTDDNNNAYHSAGSSISRTNSDVSLYMPMRRRSVVQTPGVATRAHHSNPPVSAKSSFRKSLPPTPSQSRHNSIESGMARRMSMPTTIPSQTHSSGRAVTPVEADYKQLGGMKFGSLRITNGAPVTSPVPENDVKQQGASKSTLATPCADCFDEQAINPTNLVNEGLNTAETRSMTTGKVTAQVPSSVAEHLGNTDKSRTGHGQMSENGNAVSFPVAEVLHLKEDTNSKPDPKKMHLDLEHKMLRGLTRSDSGFIPSPSSEKTQRTASRNDSGYSSNVSLRSLPSLRSGFTEKNTMATEKLDIDVSGMSSPSDSNSARTSSLVPSQTRNRLPIHLEVPLSSVDDDTSTSPTSPTSPTSRPFSPFAIGSRIRLSSLKSTRSFEPRVSSTATTSILLAKSDDNSQLSAITPMSPGAVGSFKKTEGVSVVKQTMPNNARGLKSKSRPRSRRSTLRNEPSKDTLHTILSVESQTVDIAPELKGEETTKSVEKLAAKKPSRRQSWRQSIAQMFGTRSADASPTISSLPEPTPRRPSTSMGLSPQHFGPVSGTRAASSRSSRPAPRKTASSSGSLPSPTRKTNTMPGTQERRDKPELAHLRTNSSAPNLSASRRMSLGPSQIETQQGSRTRASPPVSMQNRNSKSSRGKQGHSRSMTPSFPINSRPTGRRLSLPQDYGRTAPQNRHVSHGRTESRNSNRGMPISPGGNMGSQSGFPVQQPRVLSYSSNAASGAWYATLKKQHYVDADAATNGDATATTTSAAAATSSPIISSGMGANGYVHSQTATTAELHDTEPGPGLWASNMVQQYPNIYVTGPVPNQPTHGRQNSQGGGMYAQDPSFRVLHSYNSPAYRHAPIWSQ